MDNKDLPPEGKVDFGQLMEQMLRQAGEEAVVGFARLGVMLRQLQDEYGKEPTPEEAAASKRTSETADAALLEAITLFFVELSEDEELNNLRQQGVTVEQQIESGVLRAAALRTIERLKAEGKPVENNAQEVIEEALPLLIGKIPKKHIMPTNLLANRLTQGIIDTQAKLDVGRTKGKIETRCILNYEGDNVQLSSRHPYTEYDRSVHNGAISLYVHGEQSHVFTADMVYRAMTGKTEEEYVSPQQKGAVVRSLDKQRFVRVILDCTDELKKRGITWGGDRLKAGKRDTYLLNLSAMDVVTTTGKHIKAYRLNEEPVLYSYAALTGQVQEVSSDLLDIHETKLLTTGRSKGKLGVMNSTVKNDERRIAIKEYLLRRIAVMKGKSETSNRILLTTMLDEAGIDEPNKNELDNIKRYVLQVLDYWIAKKYIKGYNIHREKKTLVGYDILY